LLESIHLALAHNVHDEQQRHVEKEILPNLTKSEKTKLSIERIDKHTLPSTPNIVVKVATGVRVELKQIYLPRRCSHHPMMHRIRQALTLTIEWRNKVSFLLLLERQGE
jgi:hypothetical protein